ncbi:LamG-like jellyroll fold domain-containing protein [Sphingobacterium sp.]|uniref:LamG-like jellyroll fold domain-containing protein n=1 Tax=Sphingobacterium sp. TaxID=341027 RepID=UPI0028A1277F|nr:LamG-like jellyroll fold domain-containing protein [Sphingobacterium sp.]
MIKYFKTFKYISLALGTLLVFGACNKDFPNLLQNFNEAKDSPESRDKVLLVIVDGLSGPAMQEVAPTNIDLMTRNGLVTYGSLADPTTDFEVTNQSVAASLLTGVNSAKNKVFGTDLSPIELNKYPTIFTKLRQNAVSRKSSLFTSDATYGSSLGKDAEVKVESNDVTVVSAASTSLSTNESDLNVIHLTEVDKAGKSSTYSAADTKYVAAINVLDKQVQSLWETIKKRESFNTENWVVIVTSGRGAVSTDPITDFTPYGDSKRDTYTLFYSPKFARKIVPRPNSKNIPFVANATRYTYASNNQVIGKLADVNKFNMGTGSDWTMTLFLKHNVANASYNYPIFFAKRVEGFSGEGWNFFLEGNYWGFNSSIAGQAFGPTINDGEWHALTAVIKRSGSQDSVYVYTDGTNATVSGKSSQVSANGNNLDNASPLTLGYNPGNGNTDCNISICNVQVYNRAFSAEEVKRYGGVTHIDESYPFWSNLQGYWPGYGDVNTTVLTEKTGKGAGNFKLTGPVAWTSFNELVPFFQPPIEESFYRLVPNAVDIPFMIYQWLGVSVESSWNLDGKSWTPNYTQIRK